MPLDGLLGEAEKRSSGRRRRKWSCVWGRKDDWLGQTRSGAVLRAVVISSRDSINLRVFVHRERPGETCEGMLCYLACALDGFGAGLASPVVCVSDGCTKGTSLRRNCGHVVQPQHIHPLAYSAKMHVLKIVLNRL